MFDSNCTQNVDVKFIFSFKSHTAGKSQVTYEIRNVSQRRAGAENLQYCGRSFTSLECVYWYWHSPQMHGIIALYATVLSSVIIC